jgi:hypothetical protein
LQLSTTSRFITLFCVVVIPAAGGLYKVTRLAISMSLRNKSLTNQPHAKLPTRKRGKLHMTPDKSFFERDRAGSSIFGKLPRYFFGFIKIRA